MQIVRYLLSIRGIKTEKNTKNNEEQCNDIRSLWWKNLEYKGDWLQEVQGTMMLVATVIATVAFQGAINPPDGVWQQEIPFNSNITIHRSFHSSNTFKTFIAGTAVMAYPASWQGNYYTAYLVTNSISFFALVCLIMFIIGRLPSKNRICSWLLIVTMCVAIASLSHSYILGVWLVNSSFRNSYALELTFTVAWYILLAMVGVVSLRCIVIPFLLLVVSLLIWAVKRLVFFGFVAFREMRWLQP